MYHTGNPLRPLFALFLLNLTLSLLLISSSAPFQAQAHQFDLPANGYFLKPDVSGIVQLWQLPMDGSAAISITNSPTSLGDYAISNDGTQFAYTADGQLWLQSFGEETAVALTVLPEGIVNGQPFTPQRSSPVFSLDDTEIVYRNLDGVFTIPVTGGEPRLIMKDIPQEIEIGDYDLAFIPARFIPESDLLIGNISGWHTYDLGLVDLVSGEYQQLPQAIHTDALPLSSGELLIFGNSGYDGQFNLQIAPANDLEQRETLLDFMQLTEFPLYVEQVVEIEPGIIRVLCLTMQPEGATYHDAYTYFDFDVEKREIIGEVITFPLLPSTAENSFTFAGEVSPDGRILAQISNIAGDRRNGLPGLLTLYELETGKTIEVASEAFFFRWH